LILYFSIESPHQWVILDRKQQVLDEGVAETLDGVPVHQRRLDDRVAVAPGELVTIHTLAIPARSRSKAVAAVPYMLEESLASNIDDLEFRMLEWVRGGESTVAVVSREVMDDWHDRLRALPAAVTALVPEYFLLPQHTGGRCTLAADGNGRIVIRTRPLEGLVIDDDELELWWENVGNAALPVAVNSTEHARRLVIRGGAMVTEWHVGQAFPEWIRHGYQVPDGANLLRDDANRGEAASASAWMKAAAVLLGLALLLRVGIDVYDQVTLSSREARLDRNIEAALKDAFPDITRVVNPRAQMEQRLKALRPGAAGGDGFLSLLSVVASAVTEAEATVEEITFRDNALLVTCRTRDFEALDRLQRRFGDEPRVRSELVSSGSRDNSVSGRFRLDLRTG
jgi:general secretion pathway protein L